MPGPLVAPQKPYAPTTPSDYGVPSGTAAGYLSRKVFVHASSTKLGTTFAGVTCEAVTTWTTAADIPRGAFFEFQTRGPASGAGSGAVSAQSSGGTGYWAGGPSGGGANPPPLKLSRKYLVSQLPIVFLAPLGGVGGTPVSIGTAAGNSSGVAGSAPTGGASITGASGVIMFAGYGAAGVAGAGGSSGVVGTGGGGCWGNGSAATGGAPRDGVLPSTITSYCYGGADANARVTGGAGQCHAGKYGGGGGASVGTGGALVLGGASEFGGGGGGHGGRAITSGFSPAAPTGGSDGGAHNVTSSPPGGGGGLAGASTGLSGADGADGDEFVNGCGGGGGYAWSAAGAGTGGSGGNGGFPGGGAGSGAGALATGNVIVTSGRGGKGGDACIIVTAYA